MDRNLRMVRAVTGCGDQIALRAIFDPEDEATMIADLWDVLDRLDPIPPGVPLHLVP